MLSFLFIKNSPVKLYEAYCETTETEAKDKFITRLLELDSEEFLTKIFKKSYSEKIFDYLYPRYLDNANQLYEIFPLCPKDIQIKIINQLLILENESILLKFIKTEFEALVINYFINIYKEDIDSLLTFAKNINRENQFKLVQLIINLKKASYIKKLYHSEFKEIMIDFLVNNYAVLNSENDEFLLAQDQQIRDEIIQKLLKQKTQSNKNIFNIDFLQIAVLQTHNCDINEFLIFWEPFIPILCLSDSLLKFFFNMLNDIQKLYLLLWHYGLDKYLALPKLNYNLTAIESEYYTVNDCKSFGFKHIENVFDNIFHNVVERFDFKLGILSYLIDNEKFEFYLSDAEIFMEEMLVEKIEELSERINDLNADYTKDLDIIQGEIDFLIFKKNFEKLKTIAKYKNPKIEQNIFIKINFESKKYIGKKIDFSNLNPDTKLVDNINREKLSINSHIEKMTNQMTDQKTVNKMIEAAEKKLASMIDLNDFLYNIQDLKIPEYANPELLCETLANILQKTNNTQVQKAILKKAMDYTAYQWSNYLASDNFDYNDIEIAYYYNCLIKSQANAKLLLNLANMLNIKPQILQINSFTHLMECPIIAISANNQFIASCGKEKTVNIIEMETKQNFKYYHNSEIIRLYFSADAKHLYSIGADNAIKSFNLTSKSLDDSIRQKPLFELVLTNQNASFLFGKNENELKIFDPNQRSPHFVYKHSHFIQDLLITKDDKQIISYTNYEVRICEIKSPDEAHIIKTKRSINSLEISNNNHQIIIGMGDRWKGEIKIYDLDNLKETFTLETECSVRSIAISSCSTMYAYLLNDKDKSELIVNDIDYNKEIFRYSTITQYNKVIFWPETQFLVNMADYKLDIYDLSIKKLFFTMQFSNKINDCKISSDGSHIVLSVASEVKVYCLLDIVKMSAYNALQNLLSFRIEQDAESIEFIKNNADKFLNHELKIVRESFKEIINYFL